MARLRDFIYDVTDFSACYVLMLALMTLIYAVWGIVASLVTAPLKDFMPD